MASSTNIYYESVATGNIPKLIEISKEFNTTRDKQSFLTKYGSINDLCNGSAPLHLASKLHGKFGAILKLYFPECNPNILDSNGDTPMKLAIEHSNIDFIKIICDYPNFSPNMKFKYGETYLHIAIRVAYRTNTDDAYEICAHLLLKYSQYLVNNETEYGETPLIMAVRWGLLRLVKILLKFDVDFEHYDKHGRCVEVIASGFKQDNFDHCQIYKKIQKAKEWKMVKMNML